MISYGFHKKPHNETLYIHAKSNLHANILKKLPISIKNRLRKLSSNPEIFHEASKHYQNIISQSRYDYKIQCQIPNIENENKSKLSRNYKRNIIRFNSSFSKDVSNKIGKYFLLLFQKHFPNSHKYHKVFNKNNLEISYSCMANSKSIISIHNKEVITERKTQTVNCNCTNNPDFRLYNQMQISNIMYKSKITSNL